MSTPTIAFVVGHANWGKSKTLRALTDGNCHQRRIIIGGVQFFIRRMSNDDDPGGFVNLMTTIDPSVEPRVIAAFCPNFDDEEAAAESVLGALRKKGYRLFFWVMQNQYGTGAAMASKDISRLLSFGRVEVVANGQEAEAGARAKEFKHFVANVVLA